MNNYRLSTNTSMDKNIEIPPNLIDEVLNMQDIYIKDQTGLRIKALDGTKINFFTY